jgi:putative SOS response-associated peptidase YedK
LRDGTEAERAPRYDIAPTQQVFVCVRRSPGRLPISMALDQDMLVLMATPNWVLAHVHDRMRVTSRRAMRSVA